MHRRHARNARFGEQSRPGDRARAPDGKVGVLTNPRPTVDEAWTGEMASTFPNGQKRSLSTSNGGRGDGPIPRLPPYFALPFLHVLPSSKDNKLTILTREATPGRPDFSTPESAARSGLGRRHAGSARGRELRTAGRKSMDRARAGRGWPGEPSGFVLAASMRGARRAIPKKRPQAGPLGERSIIFPPPTDSS